MERQDKDLAFMLRYENIAWYENGEVRILDRRVYPARIEYVRCKDYREVIAALRDMVTQSAGPYPAAAAGMALAAYQCREKSAAEQEACLTKAAEEIANARLESAKQLLSTSSLSMKEISQLSGFSSPEYFCRGFTASFGISPTDYRQQDTSCES